MPSVTSHCATTVSLLVVLSKQAWLSSHLCSLWRKHTAHSFSNITVHSVCCSWM